jgi:hypothetical protein
MSYVTVRLRKSRDTPDGQGARNPQDLFAVPSRGRSSTQWRRERKTSSPTRCPRRLAAFLRQYALTEIKRWQLIPTSANGQPALAGYLWNEQIETFTPYCLYVLALRKAQIGEITAFVSPETFGRFGLPESVA